MESFKNAGLGSESSNVKGKGGRLTEIPYPVGIPDKKYITNPQGYADRAPWDKIGPA